VSFDVQAAVSEPCHLHGIFGRRVCGVWSQTKFDDWRTCPIALTVFVTAIRTMVERNRPGVHAGSTQGMPITCTAYRPFVEHATGSSTLVGERL
jgi:hypothetical protein